MISLLVDGIRICLDLDLSASINLEGDLAVKINLDVEDVDSIIRRRYGCLVGPRWSASSIIINRETLCSPSFLSSLFSLPAGAWSPSVATVIFESKESSEDLPASVSDDDAPSGRKKSSNFEEC